MDSFGERFKITLTGTARGESVGCVLSGIPGGTVLDEAAIKAMLIRRAPRADGLSTPRRETDAYELASGVVNGVCTGEPLTVIMKNRDVKHGDPINIPRPSHADLALKQKFGSEFDPYDYVTSGRMTAPIVFAGAVAMGLIKDRGVSIGSHILSIGTLYDRRFDKSVDAAALSGLDADFPLLDRALKADMLERLHMARQRGDSLGGSVECAAVGLPTGLGEPFFNKLSAKLAHAMLSIPAVRGIWFGDERIRELAGSEANDPIGVRDGRAVPLENRSGGLNGGMTNGMPLIVGVSFRPAPTIRLPQRTVELDTLNETEHSFISRSDVCVLPRAAVVAESMMAIALIDELMR